MYLLAHIPDCFGGFRIGAEEISKRRQIIVEPGTDLVPACHLPVSVSEARRERLSEQPKAPLNEIKNNEKTEHMFEQIQLNSNEYYTTNSQILSN